MQEPTWLKREFLEEMQADQLRQHGGLSGIRYENALDSALALLKNRWVYQQEGDLFDLAAAYGFAFATSHPYPDVTSIAFLAMYLFLGLNDFELEASQTEVVDVILQLATGSIGEVELAEWLRVHSAAAG